VDGRRLSPDLPPLERLTAHSSPPQVGSNRRIVVGLLAVVVGSLLFVPLQPRLYRAFCEWTGLYDIDRAQRVAASALPARPVTLEFDANSHDGALRFRPRDHQPAVKTGDIVHVTSIGSRIRATRTVIGQAVPSYGPQHAGGYVKKLDCFCFKQQTFAPHEVREMPVVFFLDKTLPEDVNTLTLSYTFFEVPAGSVTASATSAESRK
jgi:cytochrome c oxidase assembly protein subunit 11